MIIHEGHIHNALIEQTKTDQYFIDNPCPDGYKVCPKCGGKGKLPHYYHRVNGICFCCKGNRIVKNKPPK